MPATTFKRHHVARRRAACRPVPTAAAILQALPGSLPDRSQVRPPWFSPHSPRHHLRRRLASTPLPLGILAPALQGIWGSRALGPSEVPCTDESPQG